MTEREAGPESARVAAAMENADAVCALLDGSGGVVWANAAAAEATGRPNDEIRGMHAAGFFEEGDHERVAAAVAAVAERGHARLTAGLRTAEGEVLPYEFVGTRIDDGRHSAVAVGWPAEADVDTAERQAILERMAEGFLALDTEGKLTYLNGRAHELLAGLSESGVPGDRTDLYGRVLWDLVPENVGAGLRPRYEEAMGTQEPAAFELHRTTSDRFFEGDMYPSESGISVYVREVTERRRATRERRRSERALRELYRVSADPDLEFTEKLERVLDIGCERLGLPFGFLTRIDGGTQTVVALQGNHPPLEPGESCPLEEAYCRRTVEKEEPLIVVDAAGDERVAERARERFGLGAYVGVKVFVAGELYGTLCFAAPNARPAGFGAEERNFVELLSQWVRYELEHSRDEAVLKRQNERLEEFASIVSHDIRNPLNVAQGNVELAMETGEGERLEAALGALERAEQLVGDVLALARQGRVVDSPEPVELRTVANAAWGSVSPENATLEIRGGLRVEADRERLRAMFENLFRNAVEHGSTDSRDSPGDAVERGTEGGSVRIEVGPLPDGSGFYVADDGPGIPAADAEQIFEHGFTTNEEGTGLGLSIVRSIAEAHGWRVELADTEGARFEFRGVEAV
jgi:PAS domain S-box-containing protein